MDLNYFMSICESVALDLYYSFGPLTPSHRFVRCVELGS